MADEFVVDVRGLPCPQPVIMARKAMLEHKSVAVWVSRPDQADNVSRMAERSGWRAERTVGAEHIVVRLVADTGTQPPQIAPEDMVCATDSGSDPVHPRIVVIESECMGRGDDALGRLLMKAFLNTLKDCNRKPEKIVFFNSGVLLTIQDSPVVGSLTELESSGIEILVCGTCLDFFKVKDRIAVGIVSNMLDIAETMLSGGMVYLG